MLGNQELSSHKYLKYIESTIKLLKFIPRKQCNEGCPQKIFKKNKYNTLISDGTPTQPYCIKL